MVNVKFRNQIKILSDGYNIKSQTPKDKKQTEIQQDAAKLIFWTWLLRIWRREKKQSQ